MLQIPWLTMVDDLDIFTCKVFCARERCVCLFVRGEIPDELDMNFGDDDIHDIHDLYYEPGTT